MENLKTPGKINKRERVLSYDELKSIWAAAKTMREFGSIMHLCILTGQRRGELSKLSSLHIQQSTLSIPSTLTKNKREHLMPLTTTSIKLLTNSTPSSINWGHRKADLDKLCPDITEPWVIHDLRRTFSSHLNDLGVDSRVVERILNHTIKGVEGVYNRATYQQQMRQALELWETELTKRGVIT
jgi:integrase